MLFTAHLRAHCICCAPYHHHALQLQNGEQQAGCTTVTNTA